MTLTIMVILVKSGMYVNMIMKVFFSFFLLIIRSDVIDKDTNT